MRWSADGKTLAVNQIVALPNEAFDMTKVTRWIELMDLDSKNRRRSSCPSKNLFFAIGANETEPCRSGDVPMNSRVDRSLASFPRRTFLKTVALAGLSPLAFAQAYQDKDKHKNGRLFVFVYERDMNPGPTDPAMTGMFAIDPESGVWERIATTKETGVTSSISPKDHAIAATRTDPEEQGVWIFEPGGGKERRRIIDKKPARFLRPFWSADGRRLLATFLIKGRENEAAFETFTFRRDGTGLEKIPLAETDVALAWSPDNRSLLVAAGKDQPGSVVDKAKWPISSSRSTAPAVVASWPMIADIPIPSSAPTTARSPTTTSRFEPAAPSILGSGSSISKAASAGAC